MILNHMDASIQKCCDLKRSCTPASQGSHQKPNKFQNSNGQFFFRLRPKVKSPCFYYVWWALPGAFRWIFWHGQIVSVQLHVTGSHQKPNKFQNSNGQFFFRSRCFYRVGRGSGNKPYFIFGLIKYLTSTSKICLYIWNVTCSWTDTICPCQNIHRNAPGRAHHT
jgi:hypothetical protein